MGGGGGDGNYIHITNISQDSFFSLSILLLAAIEPKLTCPLDPMTYRGRFHEAQLGLTSSSILWDWLQSQSARI